MGAWGEKTFEDDSSLDLIDEWMNEKNPEDTIARAIKDALAMDYLEYEAGHAIAVASAVLDYTLNGQSMEDEDMEEFESWLQTLSRDRLEAMRADVVAGLDKLLGDQSELAELWAENEELFPAWSKILEDRKARLLVQ